MTRVCGFCLLKRAKVPRLRGDFHFLFQCNGPFPDHAEELQSVYGFCQTLDSKTFAVYLKGSSTKKAANAGTLTARFGELRGRSTKQCI